MKRHAKAVVAVLAMLLLTFALAATASAVYVNTSSFSGPGTEDGQLSHPKRAAVDLDSGDLYVVDQANDRVQVFDSADNYSAQFGSAELDQPFGIAIDQSDGDIYASDANGTIRFNEDFSLDGDFTLSGVTGPLAFDQGADELLVADGGTIRRFAQDGSPQGSFDGSNGASAFTNILDIAVDSNGDVIAIEANGSLEELVRSGNALEADCETPISSEVRRYSSTGAFEAEIGPNPGCAHAVAIAPSSDNVLIAANAQSYENGQPLHLNVFAPDNSFTETAKAQGIWNLATGLVADADRRVFMVTDEPLHDGYGPVGVYFFEDLELKAPEVTIENASGVEYTLANVKGTADANGSGVAFEASCRFEFVTEAQFEADGFDQAEPNGQTAGCDVNPVSGDDPQNVEATLTGLQHDTTYHLRLFASNMGGTATAEAASTFTTLEIAKPLVSLEPVSAITSEEASFDGEVNPNAPEENADLSENAKEVFATEYRFECTPACPATPEQQSIEADNQPTPVSFDPEGLQPNTDYTVKLIASNRAGEEVAERSFKTEAVGPTAITHLVANLMDTTARFTGFVDPQNQQTSYWFEYGTDPGLDGAASLPTSEDADAGSGGEQVTVARDVSGLDPETTYYFRLVSSNATGTTEGEIHSFTTRAVPPPKGSGVGAYGDRAIEMVSDVDLNGQGVRGLFDVSGDGERALWGVWGGTPDASTGANAMRVSERTPTGWLSRSAAPDRSAAPHSQLFVPERAWSRDLRDFFVWGMDVPPGAAGEASVYEYSPVDRLTTPMATFPQGANRLAGALTEPSEDLEHLFVNAILNPWLPADPSPDGGVYDFGSGRKDFVSVLPGSSQGTACLMADAAFPINAGVVLHENLNLSSASGERLYFNSRDAVGDCSDPLQLYLREAGPDGELGIGTDATTTLVSGPALSGELRRATFIQGAEDGSWAFYWTATRLTTDDTNTNPDIYRYTVGEGNECITCVVADADVIGGGNGGEFGPPVQVARDGSRLYFLSQKVLAPGAVASTSLYRWREGSDQLRYIAPVTDMWPKLPDMAEISADGSVLAFIADGNLERDLVTGTETTSEACRANSGGGCEQVFLYDDEQGSLTCVSCAQDGPTTVGVAQFNNSGETSSLSGDGTDLVFATGSPLVAADVNGAFDYYEWREGEIGLLSDGLSPFSNAGRSLPEQAVESEGGPIAGPDNHIYFRSGQPLDPAADGTLRLYTARIGGGFAPSVPPAPCAGDGCQGAPSAPPPSQGSGSLAFNGPGNQTAKPKPRCAKGKAKRKGRCVKKKASKRKSAKRAASKNGRTGR